MTIRAVQLIEQNAVRDYSFVGNCGEAVTTNAEKLLQLLHQRRDEATAALFALPRFDPMRQNVMWFGPSTGSLEPFGELSDEEQARFLDDLAVMRDKLLSLSDEIQADARNRKGEAQVYAQLLPLLLNFPKPVEYHLFRLNGQPIVINWGMNKGSAIEAADTVGPFIDGWRQRLEDRRRQALEQAEAKAREESFLGRLTRAGAKSGAVTVSLLWNDRNDLDLRVQCPNGEEISFFNKQACGGILDVDRNAHPCALTDSPVENICWSRRPSQTGEYRILVNHFRRHDDRVEVSPFTLRLQKNGKVSFHTGEAGPGETRLVTRFQI